jgi:hypothetical protein
MGRTRMRGRSAILHRSRGRTGWRCSTRTFSPISGVEGYSTNSDGVYGHTVDYSGVYGYSTNGSGVEGYSCV